MEQKSRGSPGVRQALIVEAQQQAGGEVGASSPDI